VSGVDDKRRAWVDQARQAGWQAFDRAFTEGREQLTLAAEHFARAEAECRRERDYPGLVGVLSGLGAVHRALGDRADLEKALRYYWEEVDILTSLGRELEAAERHAELGAVYRDLAAADGDRALLYLKEGLEVGMKALEVARRYQARETCARISMAVADICQVLSDHDLEYAEFHLEMAADLYRQSAEVWPADAEGRAITNLGLAEVYVRLGKNLEGARVLLEQALEIYQALPGGQVDYQLGQVHAVLGRLYARSGDRPRAAAHIRTAVGIFQRLGVRLDAS
jgi:tetratricopeptide (TPR) repeat protein